MNMTGVYLLVSLYTESQVTPGGDMQNDPIDPLTNVYAANRTLSRRMILRMIILRKLSHF